MYIPLSRARRSLALGLLITVTTATPALAATHSNDDPPTGTPGAASPSSSAVATSQSSDVASTTEPTLVATVAPSPVVTSAPASTITPTLAPSSTVSPPTTTSSTPMTASPPTQPAIGASSRAAFAPAAATAATAPPPVTISTIRGSFYANSSYGNGAFDIDPSTPPVFSALYPTLNFNPPTSTQENCHNQTNVNEQTRPFYDVIPQSDGSCTVQVAAGDNGHGTTVYAGQTGGPLEAFEAVFTATLTVAQPGQVTFNVFSDDGWTLAVGSDGASHQPTYLSGSMDNAPASGVGPFTGYPVVGAYNRLSSPAQNNVTVNFPAAGTYPMEMDYTEGDGGQESLVLGTTFANPIQPVAGTDPQRQIVFVHGINGNTRDISQPGGDYSGLLGPLQVLYPSQQVHIFSYFQDRAYSDANNPPLASAPPCIQKQSPPTDYSSLIPEKLGTVNDNICDSQPDLGLNAALLSEETCVSGIPALSWPRC